MFGLIIMDKLFHMEELNTQNIKILTIFYGQTVVLLIGLKKPTNTQSCTGSIVDNGYKILYAYNSL